MGTSSFSNRRLLPKVALLFGCASAVVCPTFELTAQEVQFRPQAGLDLPTRISIKEGVLHVRQKIGLAVGARLTVTFHERFHVVSGVTYIPGYATLHGAGQRVEVGAGSHRLSATTGARYWLLPPPRALSWEIHTGLGVVFGGQPAYEDLFDSSTMSAALGTTVRYQIGRIVRIQLRVQHRLYRVHFGAPEPGGFTSPLKVSFGLGFPFLEPTP